jgi:hypothetical protein
MDFQSSTIDAMNVYPKTNEARREPAIGHPRAVRFRS